MHTITVEYIYVLTKGCGADGPAVSRTYPVVGTSGAGAVAFACDSGELSAE